jgi:hypothetical protein
MKLPLAYCSGSSLQFLINESTSPKVYMSCTPQPWQRKTNSTRTHPPIYPYIHRLPHRGLDNLFFLREDRVSCIINNTRNRSVGHAGLVSCIKILSTLGLAPASSTPESTTAPETATATCHQHIRLSARDFQVAYSH